MADQVQVPNTLILGLGCGVSSTPSTLTPRATHGLLNTSDTPPNPVQQDLPNTTPYSVAATAVRGRGRGRSSKRTTPKGHSSGVETNKKKCKQPNWETYEISTLIQAKKLKQEGTMTIIDQRYYMDTAYEKWNKIASFVMNETANALQGKSYHRTGAMCQNKWGALFGEYKKIRDWMKGTGHNENYWTMDPERREHFDLPKYFISSRYEEMDAFLKDRPALNPVHTRDRMDAGDAPFKCLDSEKLLVPTNGEASDTWYESDPMTDDTMRDDLVTCYRPEHMQDGNTWTKQLLDMHISDDANEIRAYPQREQEEPFETAHDSTQAGNLPPRGKFKGKQVAPSSHGQGRLPTCNMPVVNLSDSTDSSASFRINCNQPSEVGTTSGNTSKRKNVSATSRLADITEKGQQAMVNTLKESMKGLQDGSLEVEDKRCKNQHEICHRHLEYFDRRDIKMKDTHEGLVRAIGELTSIIGESICLRHDVGDNHAPPPPPPMQPQVHEHHDGSDVQDEETEYNKENGVHVQRDTNGLIHVQFGTTENSNDPTMLEDISGST
jgi:hypothetical protein